MRRVLDWILEHPKLEVNIVALTPNLLRIRLKHYVDQVEYILSKDKLSLLDLDNDYSLIFVDLLNHMLNELMGYESENEKEKR